MGNEIQDVTNLAVDNKFIDKVAKTLDEKVSAGLVFPKDYNLHNALLGAYLVLKDVKDKNKKPVLDSCSKESITKVFLDMATMGLNMQKKQCYAIAYGSKLTLLVSYQGYKAMAHRYGAVRISSEVIYEGDIFEYVIEDAVKKVTKHIQKFENIGNKIIGAYCVITMQDGTMRTTIMNRKQIENAWKKGEQYGREKAPHVDFDDMMSKKTVTSRACREIVNEYGDIDAANTMQTIDEATEEEVLKTHVEEEIVEDICSQDVEPIEIEAETEIIDATATECEETVIEEMPDFA